MWSLIKKDYLLIVSNRRSIVLAFIFFLPILILLLGKEGRVNVYILSLASTLILNVSVNMESHILLYSLPMKNSHVVLSKYIFTMINYIVINIYIIIIMALLRRFELEKGFSHIDIYYLIGTLQIAIIAVSFAIPAILNYSTKAGNIINILIAGVASDIFTGVLKSDYQFFSKIIYSIWFNIGIGILLIISIWCAIESYKSREFY